jgi:hypothetical protein
MGATNEVRAKRFLIGLVYVRSANQRTDPDVGP